VNRDQRIRLAYVSQWYAPEPTGPAVWIAEALRDGPFSVHAITGIPNYPTGVVYPGYRPWRSMRETIGGIPLVRCPVYPSHDQSALRRAANYASFALSASWVGRRVLDSADVALVYSSPATAAVPAMASHKRANLPYVLLIQDLWPDTVLQTGLLDPGRMRRIAEDVLTRFDRVSTAHAAHLLVISPGMKAALVDRGVPENRISVMFNWVDESVLFPRPRVGGIRGELGIPPGDLLFMYAGNHGSAQGLMPWIDAIAATQDLANLHFVFIGDGTEKAAMVARADRLALDRTYFRDPVPIETFAEVAADADAQVVSLTDAPLFRITIPGKVQSCLALSSAVVAAVAGDPATVLADSGAAILANPGDCESIERAIRRAHAEGAEGLQKRGAAGRDYYLQKMSRTSGSEVLTATLLAAARTRTEVAS
jgi:glycosyltransferase involved in cell wall biosynthesis